MNIPIHFIAQGGSPPAGGGWVNFVPLIAMFAIFYFLLIRPQMRRQREHERLVKELKPKDKVIMNSGMYGTVVKVEENDIILEVADKVHLKFQRSAVGAVRGKGTEAKD